MRYRIKRSEEAGYAPGLSIVQYYDPEKRLWFDHGDPLAHEDARARWKELTNAS